MKNKRIFIFITFVFGISAILPVYGAFNSTEELKEVRPFQVGDSVRIKDLGIVVKISSTSESFQHGTLYTVSGLPDTYPPFPEDYRASELERVEAMEQFKGIQDLIRFLQQFEGMLTK